MSFVFANLSIKRIIVHNVYSPNSEGQVDPETSTVLTDLDVKGTSKLQERLVDVLGHGSHSIEMDIAQDSQQSCLFVAHSMMNASINEFIKKSIDVANMYTGAHTNRSWPGGALILISATIGAASKNCIIIIKAERHEGFVEQQKKDKVTMEYIENLLLTPNQKLYKVGIFIQKKVSNRLKSDDYIAYVFDSNIKTKPNKTAAKYFYSAFLGLRIPVNSEYLTQDFYEYTSEFIDAMEVSSSKKIDLCNALYSYLKTDQSGTIEVSSFSEKYFDLEFRDRYSSFMGNKNFPTTAISKDISLIQGSLKLRRIRFSGDVKIYAPADSFDDLINIISATDDKTTVEIKGKVLSQS